MYSARQMQAPAPLYSLHTALGPQGEGEHGARGTFITLHPMKASPVYPAGHRH